MIYTIYEAWSGPALQYMKSSWRTGMRDVLCIIVLLSKSCRVLFSQEFYSCALHRACAFRVV